MIAYIYINVLWLWRRKFGLVGITPHFHNLVPTKKFTVTYNRNLAAATREFARRARIQFLPMHLHFLEEDGTPLDNIDRYFDLQDRYTLAGGMVIREMLFKEMGLIPMDGRF